MDVSLPRVGSPPWTSALRRPQLAPRRLLQRVGYARLGQLAQGLARTRPVNVGVLVRAAPRCETARHSSGRFDVRTIKHPEALVCPSATTRTRTPLMREDGS